MMTFEQWRNEYTNKHGVPPREVDAWNSGKEAERERLRLEIEAKRCTPMFPGGHSFNHGIEAALCVFGPNVAIEP